MDFTETVYALYTTASSGDSPIVCLCKHNNKYSGSHERQNFMTRCVISNWQSKMLLHEMKMWISQCNFSFCMNQFCQNLTSTNTYSIQWFVLLQFSCSFTKTYSVIKHTLQHVCT